MLCRLRWLLQQRLLVLSVLLLGFLVCHAKNGNQVGDYWEHAAVVQELINAPFSPINPITGTDAPHKGLHPYHLTCALVANVFALSNIEVLNLMSIVNALLLVWGLVALCRRFFPGATSAPFWGLLFMLCLWVERPWIFSAFVHIRVVGFSAAYPSTFALAASFLGFALYADTLERSHWLRYAVLTLISAAVILSHPMTGIFLVLGIATLTLLQGRDRLRSLLMPSVAFAGATLLLVALWPYYPFFGVIGASPQGVADYHRGSLTFYQNALARGYPALAALPALVWLAWRQRRQPLLWLLLGLLVVYGLAYASGKYYFGRSIAFIIVVLQLVLAYSVAAAEQGLADRRGLGRSSADGELPHPVLRFSRSAVARALYIAACAGALLYFASRNLPPAIRHHVLDRPNSAADIAFFSQYLANNDVVLADRRTSYRLPAIAGKVVAHALPLMFVPDLEQRRRDVKHFLSRGSNEQRRREILQRYEVDYIILAGPDQRLARELETLATPVLRRGQFTLLRVRLERPG